MPLTALSDADRPALIPLDRFRWLAAYDDLADGCGCYACDAFVDYEAEAVQCYEALSGNVPAAAGWFLHPSIEFFGATPDRLLDHDGLVEVKCPSTVKFIQWRKDGRIPDEHIPQMLAQLAVTRRRYVDFVAYDPRINDARFRLFVRRFEPTAEQIAQCEQQARDFLAEVETLFQCFTEAA